MSQLTKLSDHLNLREVAALVHGKLGPGEHLLQAVQDVRPEVVFFHGAALAVDLVQHVHYPAIRTSELGEENYSLNGEI